MAFASTAQAPVAPAKAVVADRVEAIVRERLAHPQGPASISIAIVRNGETLVERAWGWADAGAKRPATAEMTYRVASIAKQFTAALILKLVDRGKVALDDPLSKYVTLPRPEWRAIKIEHLLNHTSGLAREHRMNALLSLTLGKPSAEAQLEMAGRNPLLSPPGTRHLYSNTGYMILGILIEQLYGKRYADVVRDEIARPLALTSLDWCTESARRGTEARGHMRSAQGTLETAAEIADLALGDGGLCSTAADLTRWNQALHGGRVLSAASYKAMITPRGAAVSEPYGFGIRPLRTVSGAPILTHDGATITFVSENTWYPADKLSVTVFYNSTPGSGTSPLAAQLANVAMGRTPVAAAPGAAAPAGLAAMVGFYEGRPGRGFHVTLENGALHAQPTYNTRQPLALQSGTTFTVGKTGTTITFTRDADGRVTALVFRQGDRERIFAKVR